MKRNLTILILACLVAISMTGCVNREQLKNDLTVALKGHAEIQSYSFSGTARLNMNTADSPTGISPISAGLAQLLMNSELVWNGVASLDPLQLEVDLTLVPDGSGHVYEIPLLIQNNMMYIHIPTLNSENQYMAIDFAALSELTGKSDTISAQLGLAGQLFSEIGSTFVSAMDPKFFESSELEGEIAGREITATIKPEQADEAVQIWFNAMPRILDQLTNASYFTTDAATSWKQAMSQDKQAYWLEHEGAVVLREPAVLSASVDTDGFIRQLSMKAALTLQGEQQASKDWTLETTSYYDDINALPVFTKEIPEQPLPFTEILKVMTSQP